MKLDMDTKKIEIEYFIVDVFTDVKYGGNQLAVFVDLDDRFSNSEMQDVAKEFNFSEVSFIKRIINLDTFEVRIFTPEYEVPFAGHPVLGTAYVISRYLLKHPRKKITLQVPIGGINVLLDSPENIEECLFIMEQPQPIFGELVSIGEIANGLLLDNDLFDKSLPIQQINTGLPYLIIPLNNLNAINSLKIDVQSAISFLKAKEMYKSNNDSGLTTSFFFVSSETVEKASTYNTRMFCIENEILIEDSATGSANGCFLAYLLKHQKKKVSALVEQGFQMNRKSYIQLEGEMQEGNYKLLVGGKVVPISHGKWLN